MSLGRPDLRSGVHKPHIKRVRLYVPRQVLYVRRRDAEFGVDVASGWPPLLAVSSDPQITSCPNWRGGDARVASVAPATQKSRGDVVAGRGCV